MPPTGDQAVQAMIERKMEKPKGRAAVLAIGTANPSNVVEQNAYPDFYFNVTNSNHKTNLKKKFQRMCEKSGIKKRHIFLTEEILKSNPSMCAYWEDSLDARQDILVVEVPKLAKEAALKAIEEWGQPKTSITHLVFCTNSGIDIPGADCALINLLGLSLNVKRVMLYQQGCFAGGTALRIARDFAENQKDARVLTVCSEMIAMNFRGPSEDHVDNLVGQALFSDGAAVAIVGADPIPDKERAWFELSFAGTNLVPETSTAIVGHLKQGGLTFALSKRLPEFVSRIIGPVLKEAFESVCHLTHPLDYNSLFWAVHPGGPAILDEIELKLKLKPEKLQASRTVLAEYGNMSSASVLFILNHIRNSCIQQTRSASDELCQWGVLLGIGPGVTVETIILKSLIHCDT
eukprot:c27834_g2_i1 orf=174-1385(+)